MLSECGSRLNQINNSYKIDPRSPYLMQYKIFENRLKDQTNQIRSHSHTIKSRLKKEAVKVDYMDAVKQMLRKQQNIDLFSDDLYSEKLPLLTEQSNSRDQIIRKIKAKLREKRAIRTEKAKKGAYHFDFSSQMSENLSVQSLSRLKSEVNKTTVIKRGSKMGMKPKESKLSFIGYKKDKRNLEHDFLKVKGII